MFFQDIELVWADSCKLFFPCNHSDGLTRFQMKSFALKHLIFPASFMSTHTLQL
jgi:hypothetical protein